MTLTQLLITMGPPTLMAFAAFLKSQDNSKRIAEVHLAVNSRLTQLLEQTAALNKLLGEAKGRIDLLAEQQNKKGAAYVATGGSDRPGSGGHAQ